MEQIKVTDFVKFENYATFSSYRNGVFYYDIQHLKTSEAYQFQIPLDDVTGVTLNHAEKSVTLMRWIRKSIENKTMIAL